MATSHANPEGRSAGGVRSWLKLARPGDWTKNVFVLLAALFWLPNQLPITSALERGEIADKLIATLLAFIAFCLAASGFYMVNDALDAESDRLHPVKRLRPVASRAIAPSSALGVGVTSIAAGIGCGFAASWGAGVCMVTYACLQLFYNLKLKRVIFVDVTALAVGFSLRAACGAFAIGVQVSPWLIACVFSLTLYLGFIKRLCDLTSARKAGATEWKSRAGYDNPFELNWLLGISGTLTVLMYLMYSLSTHAQRIFGVRALGFAMLTPLVLIVVHRFFRRANEAMSDSPLSALLEDRSVSIAIGLFIIGVVATLYMPQVAVLLGDLFLVDVAPAATGAGR
ncbi:MAG: UbiA prenyltransferase family protein [Phycisphaerae bacterium]|jgi:decaprenyl-phosphate phosphoribosyltransferase|nr:UbiA prenyltransferase family protein [Phycisphaerae bacterium]